MFFDWLRQTIEQKLYGDDLESTYVKMILGYDKELQDGQVVTLSNYTLRVPAKDESLFQNASVPRYGMFEKYDLWTEFEVSIGHATAGFRLHSLPIQLDVFGKPDLTHSIGVVTAWNTKNRKKFLILINYDKEVEGTTGGSPGRTYVGKEKFYFEKDKAYFEVLSTDRCLVKASNVNWMKPSREIFTLN